MLNHLPTKLIARRSDIIVSSTISITMSPHDDFKPTTFSKMEPEDVDEWVKMRSEYRAHFIESCRI